MVASETPVTTCYAFPFPIWNLVKSRFSFTTGHSIGRDWTKYNRECSSFDGMPIHSKMSDPALSSRGIFPGMAIPICTAKHVRKVLGSVAVMLTEKA